MRIVHRGTLVVVILGIFFFVSPVESAGLVPCDGPDCQACHVVELAQNILTWIISIAASVIALIFAWGGLKMVMSGGSTEGVSEAKGMMTNSIIGLIILLSAWLVIDTVLKLVITGDAGVRQKMGTWNEISCVAGKSAGVAIPPPTPSDKCPIPALSPITDPLAMQMENGRTLIWENTDPRLRTCALKMGGTITSAYRPQSYQTHLYEIWNKWCNQGLKDNTEASCQSVKSDVQAHFSTHGLSCGMLVAQSASSHGSGLAVDIVGAPQSSSNCLTWFGPADKVHYTLQPGCSCN